MKLPNTKTLIQIGLTLAGPGLSSRATAQDVGHYQIHKQAQYEQTSTSAPTPDGTYFFDTFINAGSSGTILVSSSLTPPAGSTGTVTYASDGNGGVFSFQQFASKTDLDAAFLDSTTDGYTMTIKTSTPNTYVVAFNLGPNNYPTTVPQLTNTNWNGGNLVFDSTHDFTFTWNGFTGKHIELSIGNSTSSSIVTYNVSNPNGTQTSFTLPANSLAPDTVYDFSDLFFTNPGGTEDNTSIPGAKGNSVFNNNTQFTIQTAPALIITVVKHLPNGHFQLQGQTAPSRTVTIQATSNLPTPFANLDTATSDATGAFAWEDTTSAGFPTRFYRAVLPQLPNNKARQVLGRIVLRIPR